MAASPTATWLGQDLHDLAGGATAGAGNGVQDIHILLSGLPTGRTISTVDVLGYGGGEWVVNIGPYNHYNGDLVQTAGSSIADLYLDPYQTETGRSFTITLGYSDGTSSTSSFTGGTADPNLRMPAAAATATWIGQDGQDYTGLGPGVGPDGIVDAHLTLGQLFPATAISAVTVTRASGLGWASGINSGLLNNGEFIRNATDPSRGDFDFTPDTDLAGQTLTVTITYADGKIDHTTLVAGHTDPTLTASTPSPVPVIWGGFHARWIGQDGLALTGMGDVHLALDSLPAGRTVTSATLSDEAGLSWYYARPGSGLSSSDWNARPLGLRTTSDPTRLDLGFGPQRDETGATLTLVLTFDDGSVRAVRFAGGTCDPGLRAADIAATSVVAHPGDDLQGLASSYGTVRLSAGLYPLSQPLVLGKPVTITADPGATLVFAQGPTAPTWTAAIKVLVSHVTLNGFAVRFAGPIRWTDNIAYGPAVIGSLDNYDTWVADPRVDLTFTNLDLQVPPPSNPGDEAAHLFRLMSAGSGVIASNRLKGGTTEFQGGPWTIAGNNDLGTVPDTICYGAFAGHYTHDVTIANNHVQPVGPSGKTWRFLVMTQSGLGDTVLGNTVVGIGMLDTDTIPNPNAPELLLTEAYRLHYEGQIASVSSDGSVIQIPTPQNGAARTGDVLAILSGPQAGQWRMIAQVINANTYVLDSPITPGKFAVSLATGFVNETYQGNLIDASGSTKCADIVLAGNQFGARIIGNHTIGGGYSFQILSEPTEQPGTWGWSHAPFLGATITGNTFENSLSGGQLDVLRNVYTKTGAGRVVFSGIFQSNTGVWSSAFLAQRAALGVTGQPVLVTVGDSLITNPAELVLTATGNLVSGPAAVVTGPTVLVVAGTYNGQPVRNQGYVLGTHAPSSPALAETTAQTAAQPVTPPAQAASTPAQTETPAPGAPATTTVVQHVAHTWKRTALKPHPRAVAPISRPVATHARASSPPRMVHRPALHPVKNKYSITR